MKHFFALEQALPPDAGFALWGGAHLCALVLCGGLGALLCLCYRRLDRAGRRRLRLGIGWAVLGCEALQDVNLIVQGAFGLAYLPLHLCAIAEFFTFYHALRPGRTLGNFLYSCCMPGAAFALLFPDWTVYPIASCHSLIGFAVHTLLVAYPLMLLISGSLRPEIGLLPRCFGILAGIALAVYIFDRLFCTNYMFLRYPAPGSPLEWFAGFLGNPGYLLGYLPMLGLVWTALYLPLWAFGKR